MSSPQQEPVFNTFRRKLYRPFYFLWEFYAGMGVLLVAGAVVAWVMWRGAHPDPSVFQVSDDLLSNTGKDITIYKRPFQPWGQTGQTAQTVTGYAPFPESVAADGWSVTGGMQEFDESNLYEKINGRETFYKSYGFHRLFFLSLSKNELTIDIELFDLSTIQNALGAFAGEISSPETQVKTEASGLSYATRNAGFLAQGRYYVRMIGSDDNEAIRAKIQKLNEAFVASLPGESLPWAYALFTGRMKLNPRQVQYYAKDAFTFGFADEVHSAKVKGDMEVFFSRRADAAAAGKMAGQFVETIGSYAKRVEAPAGVTLLRNEFTGTFDLIGTEGVFVIGVYMAESAAEALEWLAKLRAQIKDVPAAETEER